MHSGVVDGGVETASDRVNPSVDRNYGQVITSLRQRRQLAPLSGRGVIHFVCRDGDRIDSATPDGVKLSIECSETNRSARTFHRRESSPCVLCRIVFECDIPGVHVDVARETTDNVDLAVHAGGTNMAETGRHRRPYAPPIRRRSVLLVQCLRIVA